MKIEALGSPKVIISQTAWDWIHSLVDQHTTEVGFLGVVDRTGDTFIIREVFYPEHQSASGATCEISPAGGAAYMQRLMVNQRDADVERIRFWGHSHVNMGVSPSMQDEDQGLEMAGDNGDFILRGIFNKKNEVHMTVFDVKRRLKFIDVPTEVKVLSWDIIVNGIADKIRDNVGLPDEEFVSLIVDSVNNTTDRDAIAKKIMELKATHMPVSTFAYGDYGAFNAHRHGAQSNGVVTPRGVNSHFASKNRSSVVAAANKATNKAEKKEVSFTEFDDVDTMSDEEYEDWIKKFGVNALVDTKDAFTD